LPRWNCWRLPVYRCLLRTTDADMILHLRGTLLQSLQLLRLSEEDAWKLAKASEHYSFLSPLMKKLFCVPASSAPVERVYSHGGIMRPHRARLGDDMLSALVFLKCNEHVNVKLSNVYIYIVYYWYMIYHTDKHQSMQFKNKTVNVFIILVFNNLLCYSLFVCLSIESWNLGLGLASWCLGLGLCLEDWSLGLGLGLEPLGLDYNTAIYTYVNLKCTLQLRYLSSVTHGNPVHSNYQNDFQFT